MYHPIYKNSKAVHCWLHCLILANYEEADVYFGKKSIHINPGQFVTGRHAFAEEVGLSPSTAWFWLLEFERLKMVDIKKTSKYSIVTVLNWFEYQDVDNKKTSKKHQKNTINKNNKNKNISIKNTNGETPRAPLDEKKEKNKELIDLIGKAFHELTGQNPVEAKWRHRAWNLIQRIDGKVKQHGQTPSDELRRKTLKRYCIWLEGTNWARSMTKMSVMYEQFETYYAERVTNTRKGGDY